jgi:hypothetical protein
MSKRMKAFLRIVPVLAVAAWAAGCEDLGTGGSDVVSRVIVSDAATGTALVTISAQSITGSLSVPVNGTRQLDIRLEDRGGQTVSGGEVRVSVTNTVVAGFVVGSQTGGTARGTLQGKSPGNTTLRVQRLEGGVTSYESPSISVIVS